MESATEPAAELLPMLTCCAESGSDIAAALPPLATCTRRGESGASRSGSHEDVLWAMTSVPEFILVASLAFESEMPTCDADAERMAPLV